MSKENKKSVASQALLEMDAIVSSIKEESTKSLKAMLDESVRDVLREETSKDDSKDEENDYEVIEKDGVEDSESKSDSDIDEDENSEIENGVGANPAQVPAKSQAPAMGAQGVPAAEPEGGEGEDGQWDNFSQYKVDDNTYDLTGENDYENIVKVYKLLQNDDQVIIKKDGNTLQLKDEEAGTEYVIDLGSEDEDASAEAIESEEGMEGSLNEVYDLELDDDEPSFDGIDDEESFEDEESIEDKINHLQQQIDDLRGQDSQDPADTSDIAGFNENKKSRKPMKESKEVLFEVDLGYTDNYQDKDPIAGLSNDEPSKSGKSWHKGVPTGTKKPWAGDSKSKGDPFKKTEKVEGSVNECGDFAGMGMGSEIDEQQNVGGFVQQNSVTTSRPSNSNGRNARSQRGYKTTTSSEPRYSTNESKDVKAIKKENKELKEAIVALRKSLNEAYITNVNLGKITKLFLENTTSEAEKIDIVNRFSNEAKTVEQSKALYESINRELKKNNTSVNINESSVTANGTKALNEDKVYKSKDLLKTIDLMNRMQNC